MTNTHSARRTGPGAIQDAYPLSRLQAGMIYHAELENDASYYHDIYSLRVHGPWDKDAFLAAVRGLARAHDTLRTSFDLTKFSEPLQLVHVEVEPPLEVIDLRGHVGDLENTLEQWRRTEVATAINLGRAPLFRVAVHLISDGEFHFWWSFHHAIMDGWSLHSAVAELFSGYQAARLGQPSAFTAPRTRVRDFVALELDAIDDDEQRDFWAAELAGAEPTLLPLPVRREHAPKGTVEVTWHQVPEPVLTGLSRLAERLRVPVRTVLLAAHLRVCGELLGRGDVITGVIGNGRPETADAEHVKGLFLNAYPLRVRLPASSWADFIRAVFARESAIVPNRRYPLAAMVEETGWSPFDIVFDFRQFRTYRTLNELEEFSFDVGAYYEHTNYPLTTGFVMGHDGSALRIQFRYDPRRLDDDDMARLGRAYLWVLDQIAADPAAAVTALPAQAPSDLAAAARNASGPAGKRSAVAGLYQQVEATADAGDVAVRAADGELSYAGLLETAGRIAGRLSTAGVRRGDPVGVCMSRGALLLPALLGILRLGANYLPLDPDYPLDRLHYIAEHSGATTVLYDRDAAEVARQLGLAALPVEDAAAHDGCAAPVPVTDADIAYTIYTSGSTGLPKGVQVPHGAVTNLLNSLIDVLGVRAGDVHLATTSISFDIHVNEMFVPLVTGGTVLLAARQQVADPAALRAMIEDEPGLLGQGPPAMWRMLLDAGWRPYGMAGVLCGGEALPRDLAGRLTADGVPIWNMYGPTETTVWSAVHPVTGDGLVVPIGRPLANETMWVLDQQMRPVFPGVPGELFIGGAGVAQAYHRRPDLTADRFVPDPFAGQERPGARLYRTGDIVRVGRDGVFEYLERVDLQVKVRGYRIELEEIEARINAHPQVSVAVAAAPAAPDGERVLAGYVVATEEGVGAAALRDWCSQVLPHYMMPQAWVFLDRLPTTPNGKVDRKALPALDAAGSLTPADPASGAPRSDTERALAGIWCDVLGLPSVSVHASFFELGGHSLRALRVVLKVRDELGYNLPVASMLQASTIARLAELIDKGRSETSHPLVLPLNAEGAPRLFLFHPLGGHVFGYEPLSRLLDGRVSVCAVRAAGMEPGESPLDSLTELVTSYLGQIRAVQPAGPYCLAGWCMGASLAVEIARRLRADGEEVAFLGLIVANPFDPAPRILLADSTALVAHMLGGGLDLDYETLAGLGDIDRQIEYVLRRGKSSGLLRDDVDGVEDARRLVDIYRANARAITARTLDKFDSDAHVFVLQTQDRYPADMGWSGILTGRIHLYDLPGETTDFLEPDRVGRLATILESQIARTGAPDGSAGAPYTTWSDTHA
jgi:amino acid adenylation domain-containing protein